MFKREPFESIWGHRVTSQVSAPTVKASSLEVKFSRVRQTPFTQMESPALMSSNPSGLSNIKLCEVFSRLTDTTWETRSMIPENNFSLSFECQETALYPAAPKRHQSEVFSLGPSAYVSYSSYRPTSTKAGQETCHSTGGRAKSSKPRLDKGLKPLFIPSRNRRT